MPQSLPANYPDRTQDLRQALGVVGVDALQVADNPVGRTVAELELMLAPLLHGEEADERRWPPSRTMTFILLSCGLFWTGAFFAVWSWL